MRVRLPPVLRTVMGGQSEIEGEGGYDREGSSTHIERDTQPSVCICSTNPEDPRRNIVCLHQGTLVRAREFAGHAVASGDELVMTNALAGG